MVVGAAGREILRMAVGALGSCARELHLPEDVVKLTVNWTKLQDVPVPSPTLLSQALQQHIQHMQSFLDQLKAFINGAEECPAEDACRASHATEGNGEETPVDGSDAMESLAEASSRADVCAESEEDTHVRKPEHLEETFSGPAVGNKAMECPAAGGSRPEFGDYSAKSAEVVEESSVETCEGTSPGHENRKDTLECPSVDTSRRETEDSSTRSKMTANDADTEGPSEPTAMQIDTECLAEDGGNTASGYSAKSAENTEGEGIEINGKVHVSRAGMHDALKCPAEDVGDCRTTEGGGTETEEKMPPGLSKMMDSLEGLDDASKTDVGNSSAESAETTVASSTETCKKVSCELADRDDSMECLTEDAGTVDINDVSQKKEETTEESRTESSGEAATGPPRMSGAVGAPLRFEQEVVQIKAQKSEIDRRILAFIERKQAEINKNNVREFCNVIDCNQENSCARTDAVFTPYPGFKSHVKVSRVVNTYGPQTRSDLALTPSTKASSLSRDCGNQAVEERLQNIETHLRLQSGGPVPKDIYMRIKTLEEKILELEGLSPEYFQAVGSPGKRRKTQAAQSCSLVELDEKIIALREKLAKNACDLNSRDSDKFRV